MIHSFQNINQLIGLCNSYTEKNKELFNKLDLSNVSEFKSYFDKRNNRTFYYRFKEYNNTISAINKYKISNPWYLTSEEYTQYLSIMSQIMTHGIETW